MKIVIDASHLLYPELNERIRNAAAKRIKEIFVKGVNGQRYIGCGLKGDAHIIINGVPGNDLASFMDGPTIIVKNNGQDGIGNTMNSGKVVVYGHAGDILGYSMCGGKIFVKGDAGYRVGIHMKSYKNKNPVIVVGGRVYDFLAEYMAGGIIIVLGLAREKNKLVVGDWCGTGMHGGVIFIRGDVQEYQLGKEVKKFSPDKDDYMILRNHLREYCNYFSLDIEKILNSYFIKLIPVTHRPYGKLYAY